MVAPNATLRAPALRTLALCAISLAFLSCGGTGAEAPGDESPGLGGAAPSDDSLEPPPVPMCPQSTQGFAVEVVSYEFGEGQDFGQESFPEMVLGGPQGGGCCQGSLHVTSLGDGGHVVLAFGERTIVDGQGPDFVVFENTFWISGDPDLPLAELGRVAVSNDGEQWVEFPCEPGDAPPYDHCAGWHPVEASVLAGKGTDPWDSEVSGGDLFDLADIGVEEARFVRITDVAGDDAVFDLDAVAVIHGRCD